MEKFSRQIEQAKENPSLLHQVLEELEQRLELKLREFEKDHGKVSELKLLWDLCGHADYAVAYEASQCTVNLTLKGLLGLNESITALISNVSTARHTELLADGVTELMLRGPCEGMRHPFISLFEMHPGTWPFIWQKTSSIISDGCLNLQALKQIQPFIIYGLCFGTLESRLSLWCLLLEKINCIANPVIVDWILESFLWQDQGTTMEHCNFRINCIQQLCGVALSRKDEELGQVMAIFLSSAMQTSHKKYGFGIQYCARLLKDLSDAFTLYVEPVLVILSQFLLDCHANCFDPLLDVLRKFAETSCNSFVWCMVQFSALSIFSYSAKTEPSVVHIIETLPSESKKPIRLMENKYYHILARVASNDIQVALATASLAEALSRDPKSIIPPSHPMPDAIFLLKCAVFLHTSNLAALQDIIQHVERTKHHANAVLSLMLKKLTTPSDGRTKLAILYHLPSLAVDKICVPRVLQVLEALSGSPQLQPIRLRILSELWKAEDRVYPYLEKIILSTQSTFDEFVMAKALAIQIVCALRPEKYGAELLSVISDLLNSSVAKSSPNSATIASLALSSLVSLCRTEVVDLKSVWDLLWGKLNQDHRAPVVIEMCNLLALAPQLRVDTEEYQSFLDTAITTLFQISLSTTSSLEVNRAAFGALCCFRKEDFRLKCMPDPCKDGLKVPAKYLPADKTTVVIAENVLDYVPGICWTKLVDCYESEPLKKEYFLLLSHLVGQELQSMPIWIYRKAATETTKRNEPANYSGCLKEDSILAALILSIQRICEINPSNRLRMSLALKLLAGPFEKPLPPLDWSQLQPVVQQYNLEPELLEVVFPQVPHSFSAQAIAESVLISDPLELPLALVALAHLGPICKAVPLKYVRDFLERTFNELQSDVLPILEALRRSLSGTVPPVPAELKQTIEGSLMAWLPILPDELEWMQKVADCVRCLSWTDCPYEPLPTTSKKFVTVLLLASLDSKESKAALDFLHKAFQHTLFLPRLERETVDLIYRCISAHGKSSPNLLLQYMSYVQLVAMRPPKEHENFINLMGVFCFLVLFFSNMHAFHQDLQGNEALNYLDKLPLCMSCLFCQPHWSSASRKSVLEWVLSVTESDQVSSEEKRHLIKVIPTLSGCDKDVFLKMVAVQYGQ